MPYRKYLRKKNREDIKSIRRAFKHPIGTGKGQALPFHLWQRTLRDEKRRGLDEILPCSWSTPTEREQLRNYLHKGDLNG
ncbi:MAG: hypothetical protein [Arizlama microvirus]|nr:MAG: hypothetical protein [Arizlama microvirus]